MTTNELTRKMKENFAEVTDEEIDSVDFAIGDPSENLKVLMENPAMSRAKAVDNLVNETFRNFIKECRDICKSKPAK